VVSIVKQTILALVTFCAISFASAADKPKTADELGLMQGIPPPADRQIKMINMMAPPYNRWSLQRLREFAPTREVATGMDIAPLAEAPRDLSELKVAFPDGRKVAVGDWLESAYTDGFVVLHDGKVVYERYYNGQQPSTQHLMFSVTKSFTGTMMLILMEQGLVDGAAPVKKYVPELARTAFGDATVQQVLDMTNSIEFNEDYTDPEADIAGFLNAMMPGGEGLYANLQSLTEKDAKFEHGAAFHYVTPNSDVLGWIIRRVTGKSLAESLNSMIWSPMGAEHPGYYWLDFHGTEMAGGGLSISLRDAARFGQMILQDGILNGRQVISPAIAQRIKTKRNFEQFSRYYNDPWYGEVADSYHDQWWGYSGVNVVAGIGVHGQFIYINSDANVVIAKHTSDPEAESDRIDNETIWIMHAISEYLAN
jgi:CubicO group peptidase (beta-lactamase class C family)